MLIILPSLILEHPGAPAHPSTLKVLRAKKRAPNSLFFHCFNFRLTFESIKELGNTSHAIEIPYQMPLFKVHGVSLLILPTPTMLPTT